MSFCSILQNVLTQERWAIQDFFQGGTSCSLPLDVAVSVKGIDIDVRAS